MFPSFVSDEEKVWFAAVDVSSLILLFFLLLVIVPTNHCFSADFNGTNLLLRILRSKL